MFVILTPTWESTQAIRAGYPVDDSFSKIQFEEHIFQRG